MLILKKSAGDNKNLKHYPACKYIFFQNIYWQSKEEGKDQKSIQSSHYLQQADLSSAEIIRKQFGPTTYQTKCRAWSRC